MGNICPKRRDQIRPVHILLLGLDGCGKTQIGHELTHKERIDYTSTNGAVTYYRKMGNYDLTFIEIGGNDDIRKIWSHYYAKAMGVIYIVDISKTETLEKSCVILKEIIGHEYIAGKPMLILANKIDICDNINILNFYDDFDLELIANRYRSHILLQSCGIGDYIELYNGVQWLKNRIADNYGVLKNRIKFDLKIKNSRGWNLRSYRIHSAPASSRSRKSNETRTNFIKTKPETNLKNKQQKSFHHTSLPRNSLEN